MSSRYASNLHQRDNRTQLFGSLASNPSSSTSSSRSSTPNVQNQPKGHFSQSMLSQLESQNDEHIEGLSAKVKMLKDITVKIGDEVRDSSKLLGDMEENFESARASLKSTYNRMMYMAQRSGISIKAWALFFLVVFGFFFYVWW